MKFLHVHPGWDEGKDVWQKMRQVSPSALVGVLRGQDQKDTVFRGGEDPGPGSPEFKPPLIHFVTLDKLLISISNKLLASNKGHIYFFPFGNGNSIDTLVRINFLWCSYL